ncbi:hypothetical protein ACF3NG_07485 [Aerococcaceae bacterium WGS1372]
MGFYTLVYHEVRDSTDFSSSQAFSLLSQNNYQIDLPPALYITTDQFQQQIEFLQSEIFTFLQ